MRSTYEGFGCKAVLDTDAETVTLMHSGLTVQKHKKESSPWVIPLGAIVDVEIKERSITARGYVRFVLADRVGWAKDVIEDVNAFMLGKQEVADWIAEVNAAWPGAASAVVSTAPAQSTRARLETKSDELAAKSGELRGNIAAAKQQIRDYRAARAAAKESDTAPPPANWYVDPGDNNLLRYWDGTAWTNHTSPNSQAH